jgi:hypothetical protein
LQNLQLVEVEGALCEFSIDQMHRVELAELGLDEACLP